MNISADDLAELSEPEFEDAEREIAKLVAVWEINNVRGTAAIFWDDQHIGEPRRELNTLTHPSVDAEALRAFRMHPVVDNLEGNALLHPLTTPIVEVNDDCTKARGVWWSLGIEGLSIYREQPMAIWTIGMVAGANIKEDGEWKILTMAWWQRTTKAEFHAGWVDSMVPTNTRPPLTPEQDRAFLGKYAYWKDEARKPAPEPPHKNTWDEFPDEADENWRYVNLAPQDRPTASQPGYPQHRERMGATTSDQDT
jgi:hypothetical protein